MIQHLETGFPLVGGDWGGFLPLHKKLACPFPMSSHCFDPKMLILSFSCSFWPFCPNCPTPVEPIWETLRNINRLFVLSFKNGNDDPTRDSFEKYYMPLVEIKDFNALIDIKIIFRSTSKKQTISV